MVSQRDISRQAAWCSNYEFEDVICAVDHVDLLPLQARWGFPFRLRTQKRLIFKRVSKHLVHVNPGLHPVSIGKDYDLFIYVCMTPQDLLFLSAIKGWKSRCRVKVCWITELWSNWVGKYDYQLGLLNDFDHVFLGFGSSLDALKQFLGKPCHHVSLGVDALRFTPHPREAPRAVDVYSIGRRVPAMHDAFLRMAAEQGLFYIHDTIPSDFVQPANHMQHRDLFANIAKRSRYFVAYPALFGSDETQGQSEVGARFFEGAAAGAVIIGQPPYCRTFKTDFDWEDAVVPIGTTAEEFRAVTSKFEKEDTLFRSLSRKNSVTALRHFDWCYRWKEILKVVGVEPHARLKEREARLLELAGAAAQNGP